MNDREPPFDRDELEPLRFQVGRGATSAARERVRARFDETVTGLAASAAGTSGFEAAPSAQGGSPLEVLRSSSRLASLAAKPLAIAAIAFTLGGATGAGVVLWVRPPTAGISPVERPASARPVALPPPASAETAVVPPDPAVSALPTGARSGAPLPAASALAAERSLLDRARKALGTGDTGEASRVLEQHGRRFPAGFLVEEREALTIKTLVESGSLAEAKKRGAKFRERYPKSLFGPAVDEALGAN
jgi:hypothetical protein